MPPSGAASTCHHSGGSVCPPELLHAAPEADLGGVEVAFRIDRDVVHPLELPRLPAMAAPLVDERARVAQERADLPVRAVGGEDETLVLVLREHQVPHRAV